MKTFKKTFAPEEIKYNGDTYTINAAISGSMNASQTSAKKVIEALKTTGKKGVLVQVMSARLKGLRDLHGNVYKPSEFIYTT